MEYFSPQCRHHCSLAARSRRRWGRESPRLGYFVPETALNGWHSPESVRGSVGRRLADRKGKVHAIRRRRSLYQSWPSPMPPRTQEMSRREPVECPRHDAKPARPFSETEGSAARMAQNCDRAERLRKWLGRWHLAGGPVIGARIIRGDLGNPGRGRQANLSRLLWEQGAAGVPV
jgi:hypothetical protein